MRVTADTDILVRAVVRDAELIAVPFACLCEFVWVLRRVYGFDQPDISAVLRALLGAANVAVDRPAVDAGLAVFEAGGDFADGLIAHEGRWLGGEVFASFDRKAVALIAGQGELTRLLV